MSIDIGLTYTVACISYIQCHAMLHALLFTAL